MRRPVWFKRWLFAWLYGARLPWWKRWIAAFYCRLKGWERASAEETQ